MKLLIFAPYGIGNLILLYPVLKKLKEKKIPFDIASFLGSVDYMLSHWPEFTDLYEKKWYIGGSKSSIAKSLWAIRKERYDYSVVSFPSAKPHYNLLSFLCGAKKRIGSRYPDDSKLKTLSFLNTHPLPVCENIHDVEQNLRLVQATGVLSGVTMEEIPKFCATSKPINKEKTIGYHVGCSAASQYKRWPLESWENLISQIKERHPNYEHHFFFGPDEKEELEYFKKCDNITIRSDLSLIKTKEEIAKCTLFVSNDSGLMHIASLQDVPTVSVIGPSDERRTGAFSDRADTLSGPCEFRPCSHNYLLSSHHFECKKPTIQCMRQVTPEMVLKSIEKLLLLEEGN